MVDLRSNGGGELAQAGLLMGHLLSAEQTGWHLQLSTGPGHQALSAPSPRAVRPQSPGYDGPVALLVDGRTYSAANLTVFALANRPDTMVVGQPTGGGAGRPTWHQLANGWGLRFPTGRLTGPDQEPVEQGFAPDVEVAPDPSTPDQDAMVEAAVEALRAAVGGGE